MNPLISVIIPSYKAENYITETVQAVLAQTYSPIEIIVVDDGSPCNQAKVIQTLAEKHENVRYVFQKNAGVSAARNNGFNQSKGDYIAFLDADDVWMPENLNLKFQKLQGEEFGLVHSAASYIDGESKPMDGIMEGDEGWLLENMLNWKGTAVPGPSSILVKREVLDKVGVFDTALSTSADLDFFIRVAAQYKIGKIPAITWKYRIHGNNMHKNIPLMERDMLKVYENVSKLNLFKSDEIRNNSYAKLYLVLSLCYLGDYKDYKKGISFFWKSIVTKPAVFGNYLAKKVTKSA